MNIHQVSVSYQPDQDRILVRINTQTGEALQLWLTRRLIVNLLPGLNQAVTGVVSNSLQLASQDEQDKQMLMEFKKQESVSQADFKTPFKPEAASFPVGQVPLLVTHMQMSPMGTDALMFKFEEKLSDQSTPRGLQITLAPQMLLSFIHLLETAVKASEWGILPELRQQNSTNESALEAFNPSDSPRYLN